LKNGFSTAFGDIAAGAPDAGVTTSALASALDRRSFGALTVGLGIALLLPIPLLVPQIAGLLLLTAGLNLIGGARAPATLRALKGVWPKSRLLAMAKALSAALGWIEAAWTGVWGDLIDAFALAAGLALVVSGIAALAGPSMPLGLSAIALGYGLMQRDGLITLIGAALCFASSAFVLTMLGGIVADAPFARGWGEIHTPWLSEMLHPAPKDLIPPDHANR
jgi:hypothetical protein